MRTFISSIVIATVFLGLPVSFAQISPSNDVDRLRQATDRFCLSLYQALTVGQNAESNVFFSPLSINTALLMTYLGSQNQTREELGKVLGVRDLVGTNIDHLNRAYTAVNDIFSSDSKSYRLSLANRVAVQNQVSLRPEFQQTLRQYYSTEITTYDFAGNPDVARVDINGWVSNVTNGKIKNLLPPGTVSPQTVMLLVNAIYFKSQWQYQFDLHATTEMKFVTRDNITSQAKMMTSRRRLFYGQNNQLQAQMVEIPYKSEELSMVVLLPNDYNGLAALERKLDVATWQSLQDQMDMRMVVLTFPKFKLEAGYDLVQPLMNMGVTRLFGSAQLGGMAENTAGFGVSDIVHKSFIEVNEEGTEAAGATGVVFSRSAVLVKPDDTKEFRADHPFLFCIRHNPTNLILFMGRINDPGLSS